MRILVLTKRQYTNKDLIDDRYGRLYELPNELARLGHQVTGLCLSYRPRDQGHVLGPQVDKSLVDWYSVNAGKLILPGLKNYLKLLNSLCAEFKPDIILACSDALHVIHGYRTAKKYNIPCVADLYDNFESFALTRIPGILPLFKQAVRNVSGVICVSNGLKRFVEEQYHPGGVVQVVENGFPADLFHPMDRLQCRKELGLPINARLIGTAGALGTSRGIEVLFQAARELIGKDPDLHLVLAGALEPGTSLPKGLNIHYLGELDYPKVPILFNALDVGVICNQESSFGRYCFPQKAYEMLACGLPVVAADIGTMSELFAGLTGCVYTPGKYQSLIQTVRKQLACPTLHDIEIPSWVELTKNLEGICEKIIGRKTT